MVASIDIGRIVSVSTGHALAHAAPNVSAEIVTDYLYNEKLRVLEIRRDWIRVESVFDNYEGWVIERQLADAVVSKNSEELICVNQEAYGYSMPDITHPVLRVSCGTTIEAYDQRENVALHTGEAVRFVKDGRGIWFPNVHFLRVGSITSFIDVAEKFIGASYLWGGRTSEGIDCSGLVQISLKVTGIKVPRDTILQADRIGRDLGHLPRINWARGDFLFLPGHVAIYNGDDVVIHADGIAMRVHKESVDRVLTNRNLTNNDLRIRRIEFLS